MRSETELARGHGRFEPFRDVQPAEHRVVGVELDRRAGGGAQHATIALRSNENAFALDEIEPGPLNGDDLVGSDVAHRGDHRVCLKGLLRQFVRPPTSRVIPNDFARDVLRQVEMTASPEVQFDRRADRRDGLVPNLHRACDAFGALLVFVVGAVSRR